MNHYKKHIDAMKTILFSLFLLGAMSVNASGHWTEPSVLTFETSNGEILEMPVYYEPAIEEAIPGQMEAKEAFQSSMDPDYLSQILLCMSKPEIEEPFPFEIN